MIITTVPPLCTAQVFFLLHVVLKAAPQVLHSVIDRYFLSGRRCETLLLVSKTRVQSRVTGSATAPALGAPPSPKALIARECSSGPTAPDAVERPGAFKVVLFFFLPKTPKASCDYGSYSVVGIGIRFLIRWAQNFAVTTSYSIKVTDGNGATILCRHRHVFSTDAFPRSFNLTPSPPPCRFSL